MRLDKYLKVSRIVKRRTVAKDFAEGDKVLVNGKLAKPSSEVKPGDIITVSIGERQHRYEVLEVADNIKAGDAKNLYRILE